MYTENDEGGVWGYESYMYVADWDNCFTLIYAILCKAYNYTCNAQLRRLMPWPSLHHTGRGREAVFSHVSSTSHSKEHPENSNTATLEEQVICYQAHQAEVNSHQAHTHTSTHTHTHTYRHTHKAHTHMYPH